MYKTELKHEPLPEEMLKKIKAYNELCTEILTFDHARTRLLLNEDLRKTKEKRKEFINQYFDDTERWIKANRAETLVRQGDPQPVQNGGQWQKCPKCDGQGIVSKPPYVAGDVNKWTSTQISYPCDLCGGMKVIRQ
jgi:hypothetical protein